MHIILETPRLLLRQFTEADASLIYLLNSDPDIVKYVHEPVLKNEDEARKVIINIILPQYKLNLGRWAIQTKDGNEFIGWCGLKFIKETNIIDIGYRLMKQAWGKGFATEAAQQTLLFGLQHLQIEVITGMAHIENIASLKVLEKIGMKFSKQDFIDNQPVKIYTSSIGAKTKRT